MLYLIPAVFPCKPHFTLCGPSLSNYSYFLSLSFADKIVQLFKIMNPECPERHVYLVAAVKYTMKVSTQHKRGHPDLHQRVGIHFWQGKS